MNERPLDDDGLIDRIALAAGLPEEAQSAPLEQLAPAERPELDNAPEDIEEPRSLNLHDLADRLEMPVEDLYSTEVTVTDEDGNPVPLAIGKLKDIYQDSLKGRRYAEDLKQVRETISAQAGKIDSVIAASEQRAYVASELLQQLHHQFLIEEKASDLEELRDIDPALWAMRSAEMQAKKTQLENFASRVRAEFVAAQELKTFKENQIRHVRLMESQARLMSEIPEWRNEEVRQRDLTDMHRYLLKQGFSEEEMRSVTDYRSLSMARKAMLFERATEDAARLRKEMLRKKGPKTVLKGGARLDPDRASADVGALRARLRKTGHVDDAAVLIQHRLGR
ncbi:MAG TPA: hypothetical protein PJ986_14775 [Gammaproteobacteria bacterium]|nr:hypothetical protein [Gammaproteobacteria bacterium]